jgi:hypothetical protein
MPARRQSADRCLSLQGFALGWVSSISELITWPAAYNLVAARITGTATLLRSQPISRPHALLSNTGIKARMLRYTLLS